MIELAGPDLNLEDFEKIAVARTGVELADSARKDVRLTWTFVTELLQGDEAIYGVAAGFGRLAEAVIGAYSELYR